jgi:hypothetical protein
VTPDVPVRVRDVVEDLATEGNAGFHASFVAKEAGADVAATREVLVALADAGELVMQRELVCPSCGRTIDVFERAQPLPLGTMHPCTRSDDPPFIVSDRDIVVSYAPTASFIQAALRRASSSGRAKKKRLRLATTLLGRLSTRASSR